MSAEGKLQVELAQLEYNLPRMRGMWQHLERLGGGTGAMGAASARAARASRSSRPTAASRAAASPCSRSGSRASRSSARRAARSARATQTPTIALAGYTNVGKSTLLNALTGAEVSVENRLFETLDPTTRGFDYEGRRYLVTDTVGFVRRLPHQLVEGFAATLEETLVADVVLHVADGSADEDELERMVRSVEEVLKEIGADELPIAARAEQDRPASTSSAAAGSATATPARRRSRPRPARGSRS